MVKKPTYEELEKRVKKLEKESAVRKRLELKLKKAISEIQHLREALDHVPAYVYMKDSQFRYVYANRLTLELFGCSAEDLVGCDDTRFFPPDAVKRLREVDLHVFSGEQTSEEIDVADAGVNRRVYWEVKTPIYVDPERKTVWGLLGISTDITERKQMEKALRESEDFLNQTGDMAKVGGWQLDLETQKVIWTQTTGRIHELPDGFVPALDEAINFYHPDDREAVSESVNQAIEAGRSYEFEARLITANGKQRWVRALGQPIMNAGKCVRLSGTFQDITDRKQVEQEKDKLFSDLQAVMQEVKQLSGLLPICSHCKKIRDDKGYWNQIESYIQDHSEATFSHGICKECAKQHYPDLGLYDD